MCMSVKEEIIVHNFVTNFQVELMNSSPDLFCYILTDLSIIYILYYWDIFFNFFFLFLPTTATPTPNFRWAIVGLTDQWVQDKITQ